ncbi:O-antigen ligase family protein [Novosphingobium sp. BL-8H]|uniref:O-antigen ligase family protein n=1 Tax=Novosphingobium sp. BL-8H TaxID=3127640 RepID=UPI00375654DA
MRAEALARRQGPRGTRSAAVSMPRGRAAVAAFLLLVALVFGGGGSGAGLANMAVQLAGLAVLAFHRDAVLGFFARAPRLPVVLVAATLALPLLQLVPLPPAIWQALPGRDLVTQSFDLIGVKGAWQPFSLSPARTAIAFFSLLPAFAILALSWNLAERDRRMLLLAVAVGGVIVTALGAQQLASGNHLFVFYDEVVGSADLQGTFSNRNSGALMLDIALVALVGAVPWRRVSPAWKLGTVAMAILLVTGVVLTGSRSGMMLLAVPGLLAVGMGWSAHGFGRDRRKAALILAGAVLALAAGGLLLSGNHRIQQRMARFHSVEDEQRPIIWKDTVEAAGRYWPVGSGVGSFDEVFQVDEALENLSYGRAGRVHNDFLEIALESGIVGIALVAGWAVAVAMLGLRTMQAARHQGRHGAIGLAALGVFALIALQSITDYPLRNQTLLCVAALMLALLIGTGKAEQERNRAQHDSGSHRD